MRAALAVLLLTGTLPAQWTLQQSNTLADLRGIHALPSGIAWASGSHGTVLRTTDAGQHWQTCPTPPGAEALDFRGIQAFDAQTAIVMSSGKGDLSRLYKTTDGCKTWKLAATNPDPEGFWDGIQVGDKETYVIGDSVNSQLRLWEWKEGRKEPELELSYHAHGVVEPNEGSFAASNTVLQFVRTAQVDPMWKYFLRWSSGNADHAYITSIRAEHTDICEPCQEERTRVSVPMNGGTASSGIFSFDFRTDLIGIAVGGDYLKPEATNRTATTTADGGQSWRLSQTLPHGFRSAVAYSATQKTWITVGPNGTDISTDDGRNWRPLDPQSDDSKHWNALSLPFVVGPHGRIGILRPRALPQP